MIVDVDEIKRHMKPKADSTLQNMKKKDLIDYIRTLEHNYNVAQSFLEKQAKNFSDFAPVVHGRWEEAGFDGHGDYKECCSNCKAWSIGVDKLYCPVCGAKMDGES